MVASLRGYATVTFSVAVGGLVQFTCIVFEERRADLTSGGFRICG